MTEYTNEDLMRLVFIGGKEYELVKREIMCRLQDGRATLSAPTSMSAENRPAQDDVQRYPHAAIGHALIATGLYDRMNDITGGDREARMLVQELIETVDPILDKWHAAAIASQSAKEPKK